MQIKDLLSFHFSFSDLSNQSNSVIPITLRSQLQIRIGELQKINEEIGESSFQFDQEKLIPGVFKKFKKSFKSKTSDLDRRELRTLNYSLMYSEKNATSIFSNENELKYGLSLLESRWRDSFLFGLMDCFLKNWETKHINSLKILENFVKQKLENYTGNRTILLALKKNKRFYNTKNGDLILGAEFSKLDLSIVEVYKFLGVPQTWLSYPYFSKVIVTYYEKCKKSLEEKINELIEILLKHNSSITSKRVLSKIILQVEKPEYASLQNDVTRIAFDLIGDPSNISNWSTFENATETEIYEINRSRIVLEEWITKQFIETFFKICINDRRRKKFWLKIASKNKITFKVLGPAITKQKLKRDDKISEYVDSRFQELPSSRDVSAFILYIGNYMLVEFSDAGYAFYAYKMNGNRKPSLLNLNSVDNLRDGSMRRLVYRSGYSFDEVNTEGSLSHQDGNLSWEEAFEYWFKKIGEINV